MGAGSRPLSLETSKLFTYGEDALNLSTSSETAEVTVFETVDDVILNQNSSFTGITLSGASYVEGSNSALELDNGSLQVPIKYNRRPAVIDEFDFRQYTQQIEAAMLVLDDELAQITQTAAQIQELNAQRNPALQANGMTGASLSASSSLNILSGGNSGPLLINAGIGKSLAIAADQIFATTTAFGTQANQTPEQLASLQMASAVNILS